MSTGRMFRSKAQELKGRITERAGRSTGNKRLQRQGRADRLTGNLKQLGDRAKHAFRH